MSANPTDPTAERLLQHASWIRRLARSLVADGAAAEDLVQDTWVAALSHRPDLDRSLRPWLATALRNFARKAARRRATEALPEASAAERVDPEELCEQLESERLLTRELARLEEPFRSTLLLRYFRGLEPIEIARRQETPPGTVRWRIQQGLQRLRRRLDERCGGDRRSSLSLLLLPLTRSEGAAVGTGPTIAFGEILAMNAMLKAVAALAVVVVAAIGLTVAGVLPDVFSLMGPAAEPVEVSFRSIPTPGSEAAAPAVSQPAVEGRRAAEPVSPAEAAASSPEPTRLAAIEAVIVDEHGGALFGATLREVSEGGPLASTTAGPGGSAHLELDADEGGRGVHVEAFNPGCASRLEKVRLAAGQTVDLGTIALAPGGAVSGRIVDEAGRGIAGALVTASEASLRRQAIEVARFGPTRLSVPQATTETGGDFALWGVSEGFVRVWARAPGWLPGCTGAVEIRTGQESYGVELVLSEVSPENSICGAVLDPEGQPVPFAQLEYFHRSKDIGLGVGDSIAAKEDGSFEFVLAADTRLSITARDPKGWYGPASAEDVTCGRGDLVLRLTEGRRVRLTALGADGRILERFRYELLGVDGELSLHEGRPVDGEADEVSFPVPGQAFLLRVTAPLHRIETMGPLDPGATPEAIEVRMSAAPGLAGSVLAANRPVEGARAFLYALVASDERVERNGLRCWLDPEILEEAETDAEGRFVLSVRDSGEFVVRVEAEGFAPAEAGPLSLAPDAHPEPLTIPVGAGGTIEGRVIPAAGGDPTGTIVAAHRGDAHERVLRVGPDGAFRFPGLMPGSWRVERREQEFLRTTTSTSPRVDRGFDEEVDLNCEVFEGAVTAFDLHLGDPEAFKLEGLLTLDGAPAQGWTAWLCPPDALFFDNSGQWPSVALDPGGRFELGAFEPGRYKLVVKHASTSDEQVFADDVHLSDPVTPWSLELATGSLLIEGCPTEPPEDDIPPWIYLWEGAGDLVYVRLPMPDDSGRCRFEAVPTGEGRLVRPSMETIRTPEAWPIAARVRILRDREARIAAP